MLTLAVVSVLALAVIRDRGADSVLQGGVSRDPADRAGEF